MSRLINLWSVRFAILLLLGAGGVGNAAAVSMTLGNVPCEMNATSHSSMMMVGDELPCSHHLDSAGAGGCDHCSGCSVVAVTIGFSSTMPLYRSASSDRTSFSWHEYLANLELPPPRIS